MFSLFTYFAVECPKPTFLGLVPWYQYLTLDSSKDCQVSNFTVFGGATGGDLPLVILAIVDDMLRLAGLIAVIFVIYGGIKYATSQGEPDKAKEAQTTILSALSGLAIALVAVGFVSFIGNKLGT